MGSDGRIYNIAGVRWKNRQHSWGQMEESTTELGSDGRIYNIAGVRWKNLQRRWGQMEESTT